MYRVIDVDIIKTWIQAIKNYDYSKLPPEKVDKMSTVLIARREAYENVLALIDERK